MIGVYKLIFSSKKYYVGSSKDITRRLAEHEKNLKNKKHINRHLQNAFNKYGVYCIEIVELESIEQAIQLEQYYLNADFENLYNISKGAEGGDNLTAHPDREKIIEKMSITMRRRYENMTEEEKRAISARSSGKNNPMYGKSHTERVKSKLSEFHKGNKYASGFTVSEERRRQLSESMSARVGELNPFYGKSHTQEARKKMSEAKKGCKPANSRRVIIDDVEFDSVTEASRQLEVVPATIIHRIKSKNEKYSGYKYMECND